MPSSARKPSRPGGSTGALIAISSPAELGAIIRAVRKAQGLRQDEIPGVGHRFMIDAERGKPTAHVGKILDVLRELGVRVALEAPEGVEIEGRDKP
jgi:hypothetical protein